MTARSRLLLLLLPLIAAAIAFWLLAISPKREEASDLESQMADLQSQVSQQEQAAAAAEAAREDFPGAYRRVVLMGKATPEDDDSSSLLVQLNRVAESSGVKFLSLAAEAGDAVAAPPPPSAEPLAPPEGGEEPAQPVEATAGGSPTPPAPTEANAALLPIGASIGPAGLPVMKYSLNFEGDFFRLADFLAGLDGLVQSRSDGTVGVKGRLITVDSFDLAPLGVKTGSPELSATFTITTFLTPADEGTTAGATPAGPAPVSEPQPAAAAAAADTTATASTGTP